MRRTIRIALFLILLLAGSCVDPLSRPNIATGEPVDLVLRFGAQALPNLTVTTKTTHSIEDETKIYNIYLFIFDQSGNKVYGHYFNPDNLGDGESVLSDWWEVNNGAETNGTLHIHTQDLADVTIVGICNIDAEMVNISPEQLGTVNHLSDLQDMKATLIQPIVSRSGYFPMSGVLGPVGTGSLSNNDVLVFERLDAKISFNVRVSGDPECRIASFTPMRWYVVNVPKRTYVLPGDTDATGDNADDYFDTVPIVFETEAQTGDHYSGTTQREIFIHGFSFYMMENRKAPIATPAEGWTYQDRERQDKQDPVNVPDDQGNPAQTFVTNGPFTYANPRATYVVMTGRLSMDNVNYPPSASDITYGTTLSAEVQYVIHLGDFGRHTNDFNVLRNHSYTYNITIFDVNRIRVEVENNVDDIHEQAQNIGEPEPGAEGKVSVAMEEIFICDAHYNSHVMQFKAKHIQENEVSWYVETPFNPSGASPIIVDGSEVLAGIDFDWVEFRVNETDRTDDNPTTWKYLENKQSYKPQDYHFAAGENKTMNISKMVQYLRDEKTKYTADQAWNAAHPDDPRHTSAFDCDEDPKISVTAFVNEFYYEKNPITGEYDPELWREFVNQPMRQMHILSETRVSSDKKSQEIGSSFTIQQKSIQSIYNIHSDHLSSAWGCEYTDNEPEEDQTIDKYSGGSSNPNRGNTSLTNGRNNTIIEWEVEHPVIEYVSTDEDGHPHTHLSRDGGEGAEWSTYLDLNGVNGQRLLNDGHKFLRYSCMSRNRDNDGDGKIDLDEVRWYMAATNQMIGLYLGSYGIEGDARIYQRNVAERASTDNATWRQHLVTSTRYEKGSNSDTQPRVVWAEQGMNGSDPEGSRKYAQGLDVYSTRCVRNLGSYSNAGKKEDITHATPDVEPDNYVVMTRWNGNERWDYESHPKYEEYIYYKFDCSRINEASLRYYTDRELVQHNEDAAENCLYFQFETAAVKDAPTFNAIQIDKMNEYLNANIDQNPFCPPGYRLPNAREVAIYRYFIPQSEQESVFYKGKDQNNNYAFTRTYWTFGAKGPNTKPNDAHSYGWCASIQKLVLATDTPSHTTTNVRCVKDVKVQ